MKSAAAPQTSYCSIIYNYIIQPVDKAVGNV